MMDVDRTYMRTLMDSLDAPAALLIVAMPDGTMETLSKGVDVGGMMLLAFDAARQFADEAFEAMTPAQRRGLVIALPTQEEARRLGLIRRNGRN
jgi:hypothetical protein